MISWCEVVWNEAPESKTQSSSGLPPVRSNASYTSFVTALVESSSFFFLGLLQCLLKWPALPQFQHCTCWPDLDLLLFRLEFLDFDLPYAFMHEVAFWIYIFIISKTKSRNSNRNRSKSRSSQQVQCWNCGKAGHFKRHCKSLKKKNDDDFANARNRWGIG